MGIKEFAKGFSGGKNGSKWGKIIGDVASGGVNWAARNAKGKLDDKDKDKQEAQDEHLRLGGSKEEEQFLLDDAKAQSKASGERADRAFEEVSTELASTRDEQGGLEWDYLLDRAHLGQAKEQQRDGIGDIYSKAAQASTTLDQGRGGAMGERNNALATNSLVGSTDSILATRGAELAGSPTLGQATEGAILANQKNAQAQQQATTQMLNRQAMGLAAGQGEGGALALQTAMAGAGAASGDAATQMNLQQAQQNAGMRFDAATGQRLEDVNSANMGLDARLGAAQQERANQLAVAEANAGTIQNTAGAQAELGYQSAIATQGAKEKLTGAQQASVNQSSAGKLHLGDRAGNLATGGATIAAGGESMDKEYQSNILTAKFNSGKELEDNKPKSFGQKVQGVLDPFKLTTPA